MSAFTWKEQYTVRETVVLCVAAVALAVAFMVAVHGWWLLHR